LGKKLRQIRAALNLTLEQIIERLGYKDSPVYPTNISAMERGEREPPLLLLLAYARLAGISTDMLIDDEVKLPDKFAPLVMRGGAKPPPKAKVARQVKKR